MTKRIDGCMQSIVMRDIVMLFTLVGSFTLLVIWQCLYILDRGLTL